MTSTYPEDDVAQQDDIRLAHLTAPDAPATVTVDQAARLLGVSRGAAYRAVSAGQIPTIRIGRRLLVPVPRLCALLDVEAAEGSARSVTH